MTIILLILIIFLLTERRENITYDSIGTRKGSFSLIYFLVGIFIVMIIGHIITFFGTRYLYLNGMSPFIFRGFGNFLLGC
ncbi:hypothetical protein [Cetobacterium sp. ZOR0034]|uniref:hypothetical protein n=1 Tax=Cetobacterium sp. ZOR0034 TaxID=1339239 RepID=UPI0006491377|nr:hypothetical protein [Cetobacterium sp. ZOR0034]